MDEEDHFEAECKPQPTCAPGESYAETPDAERVCTACTTGFFVADENHRVTECERHTRTCQAGFKITPMKTTEKRTCEGCEDGTYIHKNGHKIETCWAHRKTCIKGTHISVMNTTHLQECVTCPEGTYQDKSGTKQTWCYPHAKFCGVGKKVSQPTLDAEQECLECEAGTYMSAEEGDHAQTWCYPHAKFCQQGEFISKPNITHEQECIKCAEKTGQAANQAADHTFEQCTYISFQLCEKSTGHETGVRQALTFVKKVLEQEAHQNDEDVLAGQAAVESAYRAMCQCVVADDSDGACKDESAALDKATDDVQAVATLTTATATTATTTTIPRQVTIPLPTGDDGETTAPQQVTIPLDFLGGLFGAPNDGAKKELLEKELVNRPEKDVTNEVAAQVLKRVQDSGEETGDALTRLKQVANGADCDADCIDELEKELDALRENKVAKEDLIPLELLLKSRKRQLGLEVELEYDDFTAAKATLNSVLRPAVASVCGENKDLHLISPSTITEKARLRRAAKAVVITLVFVDRNTFKLASDNKPQLISAIQKLYADSDEQVRGLGTDANAGSSKSNTGLIVAIVIVVILLLVAAAAFMYMQNNGGDAPGRGVTTSNASYEQQHQYETVGGPTGASNPMYGQGGQAGGASNPNYGQLDFVAGTAQRVETKTATLDRNIKLVAGEEYTGAAVVTDTVVESRERGVSTGSHVYSIPMDPAGGASNPMYGASAKGADAGYMDTRYLETNTPDVGTYAEVADASPAPYLDVSPGNA
jgi:hypothetical protein